jgi:iron complex outermembrane receptor protein
MALATLAGRVELALAQDDAPSDAPTDASPDEPPFEDLADEPTDAPPTEPADASPDAATGGGVAIGASVGADGLEAEKSAGGDAARPGRDRAGEDTAAGRVSVGSRAQRHRVPRTLVPVAVISGRDLAGLSGPDLYNLAWLHNLGPDRVLVLVNGKRRHQRAPITLSESNDRGASGTDLNGIPIAAIERVEILSDSAAALYGPNAVGGVINIVLKERTGIRADVTGGNYYENDGNALLGIDRADASANAGFELGDKGFVNLTVAGRDRGETNRAAVADSLYDPMTMTFTELRLIGGTYLHKGASCPLDPLIDNNGDGMPDGWVVPCEAVRRLRFGNQDGEDIYVFANSEYELSPSVVLYAFGGYSHRVGETGAGLFLGSGSSRTPDGRRTSYGLYRDGYLPSLTTTAEDVAGTLGTRFDLGGNWDLDLSASYGQNGTTYDVENSANLSWYYDLNPATMEIYRLTPTEAHSGDLFNREITANADLTTSFDVLKTLRLAGGAELRIDRYEIQKGDFVSYAYTRQDNFEDYVDNPVVNLDATVISPVEGGIQGFPGFSPDEEVDKGRVGWDVYLQGEQGLTDWWTLSATGRVHNIQYTGTAVVGHLATRFDVGDYLTLRASGATGSRSPGVQQIFYSQKSTVILAIGLREAITVGDADSRRSLFQIGQLKPEKTYSGNAGLVLHPKLGRPTRKLQLGGDVFVVQINDRIVLSDAVTGDPPQTLEGDPPELDTPGRASFRQLLSDRLLGAAQFFVNAANTTTLGTDLHGVWGLGFGKWNLDFFSGLNYAQTSVDPIAPDSALVSGADLFGPVQRSRLEKGLPRIRATLGEATNYGPVTVRVAFNHYGSVTGKAFMAIDDEKVWGAKWLTDASVSYEFIPELTLTIGADNLFDVYPDEWGQVDAMGVATNEYQAIGYQYGLETHPFGFNGGFYYANLAFTGDYW